MNNGEDETAVYSRTECAMRACVLKASAMWPNAIFFLLHCGAKTPKLSPRSRLFVSLVSCNPSAISLICVAFHKGFEKTCRFVSPAKATITRCDLTPRFFCIDATLLCKFESDKI